MLLSGVPSTFVHFAGGPLGLIFSPVVLVLLAIGFFLLAVIIHLFFKIIKGTGSLTDTYKVVAYSSAALLFGVIPIIGSVVAVVYFVVLLFIGLREVHSISAVRTILGLSLPIVVAGLLVAAFWHMSFSDMQLSTGLEVSSVKFCTEISDDGKCNEKPDNTFTGDERIFIYSEVRGLTPWQNNGQKEKDVWIIQRMKITNSKGDTVFDKKITDEHFPARSFNMYWFNTSLNLADLPGGKYTLEVTFNDGYNSLKHGAYKKTFYFRK
jgi:hypothetical protein